jgi:hypothetical protein
MQNNLYQNIHQIITDARQKVVRTINFVMVEAYWQIGQFIVEDEQKGKERAKYGEKQINELAKKLSKEFGSGFDRSNLLRMKIFFLLFPKRDALRHELT